MTKPLGKNEKVARVALGPYREMGDYLWGDVFYPGLDSWQPDTNKGKFPLVIFLHSAAYNAGYRKEAASMISTLTGSGFAVLCFDQIGFGIRQAEAGNFYRRFPEWTLLGKMVHDARSALETGKHLELVDSSRIFVVGTGLGALVSALAFDRNSRIRKLSLIDPMFSFLGPEGDKTGYWLSEKAGLCRKTTLTRTEILDWVHANPKVTRVFQPRWSDVQDPFPISGRTGFQKWTFSDAWRSGDSSVFSLIAEDFKKD
jgi:pimeloyl-ACP methyl ester carboxylesterase